MSGPEHIQKGVETYALVLAVALDASASIWAVDFGYLCLDFGSRLWKFRT
jgi:hypothetical protein